MVDPYLSAQSFVPSAQFRCKGHKAVLDIFPSRQNQYSSLITTLWPPFVGLCCCTSLWCWSAYLLGRNLETVCSHDKSMWARIILEASSSHLETLSKRDWQSLLPPFDFELIWALWAPQHAPTLCCCYFGCYKHVNFSAFHHFPSDAAESSRVRGVVSNSWNPGTHNAK